MCKINKLQGYSKQLRRNIAVILQYRSSLLFSCSGVSNSLQLRGLQHTRLPVLQTVSRSLLKLMSIELVMPSNHLILCHPLLLWPSIFPSIKIFSSELALSISDWKDWSFSFSISPSNEYSGLISFRIDWFDLSAIQETLKSLLQHYSLKASWDQIVFMMERK